MTKMTRSDSDTARESSGGSDSAAPAPARFIDASRRGFLQGAAVASGAAIAGPALASDVVENPVADVVDPASGDAGYRLTDHVREYYAKARF